MTNLQVFQKYFAMVENDQAMPLVCPGCGFEEALIGQGMDPTLHCFMCGKTITPGVALIRKIRNAIE